MQEIRRTIQIKLRQTPEQAEEIEKLFSAFKLGLNFSLKQIEGAYQKAMSRYERVEEAEGSCAGCGKERPLTYLSSDGKLFCNTCVMREYSEYTVRALVIGTQNRPVANNIKDAVIVENLTHVHMMFAQAYGTWKSFNAWRNKREFERARLENDLAELKANPETRELHRAAYGVWDRAAVIQRQDKEITRRMAMAMASREIYGLYPDIPQRDISRTVNKIRELKFKSRPVHFPEYETVTSIQMHKNFVNFEDGKFYISLFNKKNNGQEIDYYSNEYLGQFLDAMQEDNAVYTNLIKREDGKKTDYYLMYPLTVKKEIPTILDLTDVFTICFSPDSVLVHSKWGHKFFRTGELCFVKHHFSEKRRELMEHNTRNSLRRIKKMGNAEMRSTRTYNHHLSHNIVEYILGHLFSIGDEELKMEMMLNQGAIPEEFRIEFQTKKILLSGNAMVAKQGKNEWIIADAEKNYIIRKDEKLNVYAPMSENPLIAMWDMTSGITADYGKMLNRVKKLWPVVQQQQFIQHKASLRCVPVKMIPYKKENVLTCSSCHQPFLKKDELGKPIKKETIKTITALLRRARNIKCEKCGIELNLLINQARNISPLAKEAKS